MFVAEQISGVVGRAAAHLDGLDASVRQAAGAAKAADAAKEFEANFLGLLLKQMRETLEPDAGLFPGDTADVQGGLFDLYLGKHLADAGGVGMAAALARQMSPPGPPAHDAAPPVRPALPGRLA